MSALDPEHNGYWQPPAETVAFQMNLKTGNAGNAEAFNDINFRHAFSLAMDRTSMVDIAGFGYPVVNLHASGLPPRFDAWRNKDGREGAGRVDDLRRRQGQQGA